MSIDTDILTTLTGVPRVNAVTSHIMSLPQNLRGPTARASSPRFGISAAI